ncbi:hypothetical protein BH10BAC3_BH10BAC3_16540 [soil metagenome]
MNDTPQHIYDLQLKSWLSKTPAERLHRLMLDNEALLKFWNNVKPVPDSPEKILVTEEMIKANTEANNGESISC